MNDEKKLSKLPTESYVTMICEFALMATNNGFLEAAQTLYEHVLLTGLPPRIDVFSLYVDVLIKSNKIDLARYAFEEARKQGLGPSDMHFLLNKWMLMEHEYGTPETIDKVQEYTNNFVIDVILRNQILALYG